ncbi:MAG TPA: SIMPL domain-containing protein [Paludibacter sp.]
MKKLIFSLFMTLSLAANSQTVEKNFIDQNYIEVVGTAQMDVTPDLIYLKIVLSEKDIKNKQSFEATESSMKNKLNEIGVDLTKDLYVKDFVSNFRSYFLSKTDIVLTKEYQLIIHDAKTLQKVFIEFQKLEISNVSIQKVDHTKMDQFRKEVKINAIKAAKEKAESLSTSINQSIGKAIFVQEQDVNNLSINGALQGRLSGVRIRETSSSIKYSSDSPDSGMEFEKINLNSSILVRFELK